jgi:hypothetical protein
MSGQRELQTRLLALALIVLGLSFAIVAVGGGLLLVSPQITLLPATRVVSVGVTQVVTPTAVLTPVTTGIANPTDIAIAATQQAKFNSEHIQYPTLPAENISEVSEYSFSPIAWFGALAILLTLLIVTSLMLRTRLRNGKR